ncbi:MAG: hypothetical protein HY825_20425 [Acidobacteria bacterium]|nr:hypothetical protein [Acidobacteriota bacterium]
MAAEGERQARCPACGCFASVEAFEEAPHEAQVRTQQRHENGTLFWEYDEGEDEEWETVATALGAALEQLREDDE